MDRVFLIAERPLETIERVAVGVYPKGEHVGLLHRHRNAVKFLDVPQHGSLRDEPLNRKCVLWVDPKISVEQANLVSAHARLIYQKNSLRGIPYGFSPHEGYFSHEGEIRNASAGWGLTCATFVLAIFDMSGIRLINGKTWIKRPEDKEWQRDRIEAEGNRQSVNKPDAKHLRAMKRDVGLARFRPLEVAGAAAAEIHPVDFATAVRLADEMKVILGSKSYTLGAIATPTPQPATDGGTESTIQQPPAGPVD